MPDCYYAIESNPKSPQEVFNDVRDCAGTYGGRPHPPFAGERIVQAYVHYDSNEEAHTQLVPIKDCLEGKGNRVVDHRVVLHGPAELEFDVGETEPF